MLSNLSVLKKYAHVALFVFYELVALTLLVNYNTKQKEIFLHSSSLFAGGLLQKSAQVGDFLNLKESNDELLAENARLLNELINTPLPSIPHIDTSLLPFDVIPARVINNSILTTHNFFTIDKGARDGILPDMGVMTSSGVAGVIKQVSHRYATVLSLLHQECRISASVRGQDYFGTIAWDGRNFRKLSLSGIPKHVALTRGLMVETNGFSTVFPKGIPIGKVEAYDISKNGVFFDVIVEPVTDFTQMGHVYVLKDNFAAERLSIEEYE